MFFNGLTEDYYIIEVDKACRPVEATQNFLYQLLKGCWCVAQAKGHNLELEEAIRGPKGCLLNLQEPPPLTSSQMPGPMLKTILPAQVYQGCRQLGRG